MGKKIWEKLNAVVPTKVTSQLFPNQEGSMKFVGRVIRRQAGAKRAVGRSCTRVSRFLLS